MDKRITKVNGITHYCTSFKKEVVDYYLANTYTKQYVWEKFTGAKEEKGTILKWMRQLDYIEVEKKKPRYNKFMKNKSASLESDKIKELEERLEEAELKAKAYRQMISIAEKQFNIEIEKKLDTKP